MILNKDTAKKTAEFLLQIKAINYNLIILLLGLLDGNLQYTVTIVTLSHHATRTYIREQLAHAVTENFGKPDVIAGVATGAIPHGILVAQELGFPLYMFVLNLKHMDEKTKLKGILKMVKMLLL